MSMQEVSRRRTLIKFAVQNSVYTAGVGNETKYETIKVKIGCDEYGNEIKTDCFYCEWLNSYGNNAIQQQADGLICPARVRMKYVKAVYGALTTKDVIVFKNGVIDDAHAFRLTSSPDNYLENNKMLEFQVKKYEVK